MTATNVLENILANLNAGIQLPAPPSDPVVLSSTLNSKLNGTLNPTKIDISGSGSTGDISSMSVKITGSTSDSLSNLIANRAIHDSTTGSLAASEVPKSIASIIQVTPNLSDLNTAIASLSSAGGGDIHLPAGVLTGSTVILRDNVYIKGRGRGVTTLKLANGINSDVLGGFKAYDYFGTTNNLGITNFGIEDLTIDGNRSNNTNGSGIVLYGYKFLLRRLEVINCALYGIRTDGGQAVPRAMESNWNDVLIDTCGLHGINANGPHDTHMSKIIVIDAGQNSDNVSYGIYFNKDMNARCDALHTWHTSGATNRTYAGFVDEGGFSEITNSHFEGSRTVCAAFKGPLTQVSNCRFYASYGTDSVVIRAPEVRIHGIVQGGIPGSPASGNKGVILGYSTSDNVASCSVDLTVHQCVAGAVDFSNSQGSNDVRIRGYVNGNPSYGYLGVPVASSDFGFVRIAGATNNRLWQANPA